MMKGGLSLMANVGNEFARFLMGTVFLVIKRTSGASEAFSLVMKTNNSQATCPHQEYVSSPGLHVLTRGIYPQLAHVS